MQIYGLGCISYKGPKFSDVINEINLLSHKCAQEFYMFLKVSEDSYNCKRGTQMGMGSCPIALDTLILFGEIPTYHSL